MLKRLRQRRALKRALEHETGRLSLVLRDVRRKMAQLTEKREQRCTHICRRRPARSAARS